MHRVIENCHPFVISIYFILSGILVMYVNHPFFLLSTIIVCIFSNRLFTTWTTIRKNLLGSLILGGTIILINSLFNSNGTTEMFVMFGKSFKLETFIYSLVMAAMIVAILQLTLLFNATLNGSKFLYVMSTLLPKTGLVTMLALRFVPMLKEQIGEIIAVQKMRGYSLKEGPLLQRAKTGLLFVQMLLTISLEDAIQTADSMKARGYGGETRTSYHFYRWTWHDTSVVLLLSILVILILLFSIKGYGVVAIYPIVTVDILDTRHALVGVLALFVIGLPVILEGLEWCRWRLYNWRT